MTIETLDVREGPGTGYAKIDCIRDHGTYTIVEEKDGWGCLKSGLGWIKLSYTKKSGSGTAAAKRSVDAIARKWGNGTVHRSALQAAGYDYAKIQARVNELLK